MRERIPLFQAGAKLSPLHFSKIHPSGNPTLQNPQYSLHARTEQKHPLRFCLSPRTLRAVVRKVLGVLMKKQYVQFHMNYFNRKFKEHFTPKIQTCQSVHGNYKIQISAVHVEYFWLRKDAKEFIKNFTKEI